jgi:hypothetical protein
VIIIDHTFGLTEMLAVFGSIASIQDRQPWEGSRVEQKKKLQDNKPFSISSPKHR